MPNNHDIHCREFDYAIPGADRAITVTYAPPRDPRVTLLERIKQIAKEREEQRRPPFFSPEQLAEAQKLAKAMRPRVPRVVQPDSFSVPLVPDTQPFISPTPLEPPDPPLKRPTGTSFAEIDEENWAVRSNLYVTGVEMDAVKRAGLESMMRPFKRHFGAFGHPALLTALREYDETWFGRIDPMPLAEYLRRCRLLETTGHTRKR